MGVTIDDFHSSDVFPMDIKESTIRDNGSAIHGDVFEQKCWKIVRTARCTRFHLFNCTLNIISVKLYAINVSFLWINVRSSWQDPIVYNACITKVFVKKLCFIQASIPLLFDIFLLAYL